ncbi:hypothetical protein FGE05_02225 [Pseudomonas sp. ICMP22404]|nr:hypothetical protein FGE05_02225 [Pseudomonas sp. ICMP22404]
MGASLLAMASVQLASMSTGPASSRAGSLPQLFCAGRKICVIPRFPCGSEPARDGGLASSTYPLLR